MESKLHTEVWGGGGGEQLRRLKNVREQKLGIEVDNEEVHSG